MIWGLSSREQWSRLGGWAIDEWDKFWATLSTWQKREHNNDGTHATITSPLAALARLRLDRSVTYVTPAIIASSRLDNVYTPGLEDVSVLRISTTVSPLSLTGISNRGREVGDLLLVINDEFTTSDPLDIDVAVDDSNSDLGNRFIGSTATPTLTLHGSLSMLLMYDRFRRTNFGTETSTQETSADASRGPTGWRVLITG